VRQSSPSVPQVPVHVSIAKYALKLLCTAMPGEAEHLEEQALGGGQKINAKSVSKATRRVKVRRTWRPLWWSEEWRVGPSLLGCRHGSPFEAG
jgi:hypothetical protein